MVLAKVDGEVPQGIEDGHVELVVLFGAEAACSKLRYKGGAKELHKWKSEPAGDPSTGALPARATAAGADSGIAVGLREGQRKGTNQHFRASISFPGVSKHLRMSAVCWRTATRASSRRRAWSSGGAGVDILTKVAEVGRID